MYLLSIGKPQHEIPYRPLLLRPLINGGPFYAGPNSATPKIWLNAT